MSEIKHATDVSNSLVIVALPSEDDVVNRLSSEKKPHLTLLYLGDDKGDSPEVGSVVEFVQHMVETTMFRFGLSVDHRGTLGDLEADVLFFDGHGVKDIKEMRDFMLKDDTIRKLYDAAPQFEGWTPHLTMGYPDAPAKEDDRDYPGINWINFDRIAVWTGDSEGFEFRLKDRYESMDDVAWGEKASLGERILAHYGVKGMKWGVRKSEHPTAQPVEIKKVPGKKVVTKGGKFRPSSDDALRVATSKQIAKKSSTDALSTKELQELVNRMNLEQNYKRLSTQQQSVGKKFIANLFKNKDQREKVVSGIGTASDYATAVSGVGDSIRRTDLSKIGR